MGWMRKEPSGFLVAEVRRPRGKNKERKRSQSRSPAGDRKSTRLNSSHSQISYAVFCLKKKKKIAVSRLSRNIAIRKAVERIQLCRSNCQLSMLHDAIGSANVRDNRELQVSIIARTSR